MIEIGLEFPALSKKPMFDAIFSLPAHLRPVAVSYDEEEADIEIRDPCLFVSAAETNETGFALKNSVVEYDLSFAKGRPIICYCDVRGTPEVARSILVHMSSARPVFGYACEPEERLRWNRAVVKKDFGVAEIWLGRSTEKQIPGLYWLTLLSKEIADRHDVSLDKVAACCHEILEIGTESCLFRLYDKPEDWRSASLVDELRSSLDGIFDIEKIRPHLLAAKSFTDFQNVVRSSR